MFRFRRPSLIRLYCLDKGGKLIHESMATVGIEKVSKSDEIILIVLITIFALLFFARSLTVFLVLLTSGLVIGAFVLIEHCRERRRG